MSPCDAAYFQSLIGVLGWVVELNLVDITMETSDLVSMMALPIESRLGQLYHIFSFLKCKHNVVIVFDPTKPEIDKSQFTDED